MKAQLLKYYCFRPMLENELLEKRIVTKSNHYLPPFNHISYVPLSSSDHVDHSVIQCLIGRDYRHRQPAFGEAILRHGLYRINIVPDGEEITLRVFKEQNVYDDEVAYFNRRYRSVEDASDSIYLSFSQIPADRWVSIERYNGESWDEVDLKNWIL